MLRRSKTLSMAHFFNRLLLNWLRRKRFFPFRYIKGWSCNVDQVSFGLFWACCGKVIARLRSVFPVFVRQINFSEFCLLSCEFADQIRTDESTHCSVVKLIFFGKFLSRHWSSPPVSDMAQNQIAGPFNHCTFFTVGLRLILTLICLPSFKTWRSLSTLS